MSSPQPESNAAGRRVGRPRSAERHHAILRTTRSLLASGGYEQLTMEAIAAGAGVSKATVYKWWPSKAAVVTEAVIAGYVGPSTAPPEDTGDFAADLRVWLRVRFEEVNDRAGSALVRAMISATADSDDSDRLFGLLAQPVRQDLLLRLQAAVAQGQLRAEADLDAAADALISVLMLRALTSPEDGSQAPADGLLDLLLHGLATQGAHKHVRKARS